jgi:hypothetical protein
MPDELDITPFTRIVWKKKAFKDEWNDKLLRVTELCRRIELETLSRGLRRATTFHMDSNNMMVLGRFNDQGLIFTPIARSAYYSGFSHKHITPTPGQPYFWYGCLTRTREDARIFREASLNAKDQQGVHGPIGKLLGYPDCCTGKFTAMWETGNYDGMFEIARNTPGSTIAEDSMSITCNVEDVEEYYIISPLLRYFGMRAINHFPCSLRCDESLRVANKYIDLMYELDHDATEWLVHILGTVESWDSFRGVVEIQTKYFVGLANTYPYTDKKHVIRFGGL